MWYFNHTAHKVRKLTVLLARCFFFKFHFCTVFRGGFQGNRCQPFGSTKRQDKTTRNPTRQRHIFFWSSVCEICWARAAESTWDAAFPPHLTLYPKRFPHVIFLQKTICRRNVLRTMQSFLGIRNWRYFYFFSVIKTLRWTSLWVNLRLYLWSFCKLNPLRGITESKMNVWNLSRCVVCKCKVQLFIMN